MENTRKKSAGQYLQDHLVYVQFFLISKVPDERAIYVQRLLWNAEQFVKVVCLETQHKPECLSLLKDHINAVTDIQGTEERIDSTAMNIANFLYEQQPHLASRRHWQEQFGIYSQLLREGTENYLKTRDVTRAISQFDYCTQILMQLGFTIDQFTIHQMSVSQIKLHLRNINSNIVLGLRHGQWKKVRTEMAKLKTWKLYINKNNAMTTQEIRTLNTFMNKLKEVRMTAAKKKKNHES